MCFAVFVDVALFLIKNYVIKVLKYISVYTDLHLKKRIIFIYPTGFKMQKKKKGQKGQSNTDLQDLSKFFFKNCYIKTKTKKNYHILYTCINIFLIKVKDCHKSVLLEK